jgi:hypothetical protein
MRSVDWRANKEENMRLARKSVIAALVLVAMAAVRVVVTAQVPAKSSPAPTFTKDVAPILQRSCQVCHRPDSIAPMSLMTYEDARPWARSIRNKVTSREMPPWYIDRTVGIKKFRNDPSLTDVEVDTITRWVDSGAPMGNPSDMPPARQFDDLSKWHIQPDVIVSLPQDIVVPAQGPDWWKDVLVDAGITEDRYLRAVETKPSKGHRVVHHSVQTMRDADDDSPAGTGGSFLNEYALGKNADVFPEGAGRLVKAGSKINFNLHLHSIGEAMPANVQVGLQFYPKGYTPKYIETTTGVGNSGERELDIPPNTDNVRTDGYTVLKQPVRLLSFQPHMHNRGKAMCVEAIYPASASPQAAGTVAAALRQTDSAVPKVQTLSCVDKYQFAWHIVYLYEEDEQPLLPAGTILHTIGYHNNTTSNRFNPDPDNLITFGQRTIDDMSFAWMSWYPLSEDDYKQMVKEREQKNSAKKTQQQQ